MNHDDFNLERKIVLVLCSENIYYLDLLNVSDTKNHVKCQKIFRECPLRSGEEQLVCYRLTAACIRKVRFWKRSMLLSIIVCLLVGFELHEQFFSYLATVTIAGDRAANLNLCLALTAFSSEGSFTCHTYCDTGPPFLRSYPKRPVILPSECCALGEGVITTYFKRLTCSFDAAGPSGARTHDLPFAKREHYH
jgi:hypothetical protein